MKIYKKPISILVDIEMDDLMIVSGEVLQKPDETGTVDATEHIGYGGSTGSGRGDSKGFDAWE